MEERPKWKIEFSEDVQAELERLADDDPRALKDLRRVISMMAHDPYNPNIGSIVRTNLDEEARRELVGLRNKFVFVACYSEFTNGEGFVEVWLGNTHKLRLRGVDTTDRFLRRQLDGAKREEMPDCEMLFTFPYKLVGFEEGDGGGVVLSFNAFNNRRHPIAISAQEWTYKQVPPIRDRFRNFIQEIAREIR